MHGLLGSGSVSRFPERWVRVGPGGRWAGFTLAGLAGLTLALIWTLILAAAAGYPGWLVFLVAGAMLTGLVAVAAGESLLAGTPRLVCFHAEFLAWLLAAGAVALTHQPVLASLDLVVPGVALFLACGRVGCLIAGCCHGRPAIRGVRYGGQHAAAGLAPEYVGVPLWPVAGVEAGVLTALGVLTSVLVLLPAQPGVALTLYLLTHMVVRFCLEFARGDEGRPQLGGVSEAQWTAVAVSAAVVAAGAAGMSALPLWVPIGVTAALLLAAAAATQADGVRLRTPTHVRELARVVRCAESARGGLIAHTTGLGIRVTASHSSNGSDGLIGHYAFSRASPPLEAAEAAALGRIATAVGLRGQASTALLQRSGNGVYHWLVSPGPTVPTT